MLGVASTATLGDLDEAQCCDLAYCRGDGVVIDAVVDEVLLRDEQRPVLITTVMAEFDFDAGDHTVRRQRQHAIGGGFQHLD
jgi:hypothetical protein